MIVMGIGAYRRRLAKKCEGVELYYKQKAELKERVRVKKSKSKKRK